MRLPNTFISIIFNKNISMKTVISLSLFILLFLAGTAQGQVRVKKGDLSALKGTQQMTIKFTYVNMAVGKFKKESEYLDKKVAEYNKKEAGKGDQWREAWVLDRTTRFEPKFLELFEKHAPVKLVDAPADTKYTMVVNTDFTEPGFNVYVARKNAEVRTTVTIIETASKKEVAVISAAGPGRTFGGNDYDSGTRLSEAYAKTAKDLAKYLSKKALK